MRAAALIMAGVAALGAVVPACAAQTFTSAGMKVTLSASATAGALDVVVTKAAGAERWLAVGFGASTSGNKMLKAETVLGCQGCSASVQRYFLTGYSLPSPSNSAGDISGASFVVNGDGSLRLSFTTSQLGGTAVSAFKRLIVATGAVNFGKASTHSTFGFVQPVTLTPPPTGTPAPSKLPTSAPPTSPNTPAPSKLPTTRRPTTKPTAKPTAKPTVIAPPTTPLPAKTYSLAGATVSVRASATAGAYDVVVSRGAQSRGATWLAVGFTASGDDDMFKLHTVLGCQGCSDMGGGTGVLRYYVNGYTLPGPLADSSDISGASFVRNGDGSMSLSFTTSKLGVMSLTQARGMSVAYGGITSAGTPLQHSDSDVDSTERFRLTPSGAPSRRRRKHQGGGGGDD